MLIEKVNLGEFSNRLKNQMGFGGIYTDLQVQSFDVLIRLLG